MFESLYTVGFMQNPRAQTTTPGVHLVPDNVTFLTCSVEG